MVSESLLVQVHSATDWNLGYRRQARNALTYGDISRSYQTREPVVFEYPGLLEEDEVIVHDPAGDSGLRIGPDGLALVGLLPRCILPTGSSPWNSKISPCGPTTRSKPSKESKPSRAPRL